jgi:hypothetical protein
VEDKQAPLSPIVQARYRAEVQCVLAGVRESVNETIIMGVDLTSKGSGRFVKAFSPTIRCFRVDETGDACSQAPEKCRLSVPDSLHLAVH